LDESAFVEVLELSAVQVALVPEPPPVEHSVFFPVVLLGFVPGAFCDWCGLPARAADAATSVTSSAQIAARSARFLSITIVPLMG
jgi:hypothetical protein